MKVGDLVWAKKANGGAWLEAVIAEEHARIDHDVLFMVESKEIGGGLRCQFELRCRKKGDKPPGE